MNSPYPSYKHDPRFDRPEDLNGKQPAAILPENTGAFELGPKPGHHRMRESLGHFVLEKLRVVSQRVRLRIGAIATGVRQLARDPVQPQEALGITFEEMNDARQHVLRSREDYVGRHRG